jgi:hypothetical protein
MQTTKLWTVALISVAVIIAVHFLSVLGVGRSTGAGPQPTSTGGGSGA